jgi:glycosyltransferase involved in cell wall biosynthesis
VRLALISSHPIQYNAPWFKRLAAHQEHTFKVFYTWSQTESGSKYDPGFKREISWDIPLLEGYEYSFVKNIAKEPGSHHFRGIDNPELISILKTWNPDAILVMGWSFKSHLKVIRYFHGKIPVIFRGDSTLLDESSGFKTLLRRIFLKWVYSHIDYALFVGENNKQYFLAHGLKQDQLVYVPHAIDNSRFEQPDDIYTEKAFQLKQDLSIAATDFVVLFAGKFEQKKNPLFLVSLAKALASHEIRFLFAGNGDLKERILEQTGQDPRFTLIDFQNQTDMPVIYRLANLFVLPSAGPGETWGLALNEAIPVIASSKTGGAIDLINDGISGKIIDANDVQDAVSFITKLQQDPSFYQAAVVENKRIIDKFTFGVIEQNIIHFLDQLAMKNGKN